VLCRLEVDLENFKIIVLMRRLIFHHYWFHCFCDFVRAKRTHEDLLNRFFCLKNQLIFVLKKIRCLIVIGRCRIYHRYTWKPLLIMILLRYICKYYAILNINRIEFDSWNSIQSQITWLLMGIMFRYFRQSMGSIRIQQNVWKLWWKR
jgi:hypothetical protein